MANDKRRSRDTQALRGRRKGEWTMCRSGGNFLIRRWVVGNILRPDSCQQALTLRVLKIPLAHVWISHGPKSLIGESTLEKELTTSCSASTAEGRRWWGLDGEGASKR